MVSTRSSSTKKSAPVKRDALAIKSKTIKKKPKKVEDVAMEVDGAVVKMSVGEAKKALKEKKQHQRWKGIESDVEKKKKEPVPQKSNPARIGRGNFKAIPKVASSIVKTCGAGLIVSRKVLTKKAQKKISKAQKKVTADKERLANKMQ
uniref:Uncharacterized protein n=1 Tax=Rhabditophanes sp. KR3021 TaxID=114890 RepID=A0AC35U1N9_9BILA